MRLGDHIHVGARLVTPAENQSRTSAGVTSRAPTSFAQT